MEPLATSTPDVRYTSANIPLAEMAVHHKEDALSLHAKVLYKKVGPRRLRSHLLWLWSRPGNHFEGTLKVFPLENDFFQLKFSNSSDYKMALEGVPWLIDGHYIYLRPWVPNFKPSAAVITKIEIWIRLQELPTEYYNKSALLQIATAVGKLIKIDPVTENKWKCKFARLCVEIDLTHPLHSHVELDAGFLQPIEYEALHILCYRCGRVGHLEHECVYLPSLHELASYELLNQSSYGPPVRRSIQELQANTPVAADTGTSGSRFQVFQQENVTNKFEKKPVSKTSTSSVIPSFIEPAVVSKTEQVPIIRFEESNDLDWMQTSSNVEGPSWSSRATTSKQLPDFLYFLESSSASDSTKESPNPSPSPLESPNLSPPMCANDEFFFKGVLRATQEQEIKVEKLQIVEQRCPVVVAVESKSSDLDICVNTLPLPSGNGNEHRISFIPSGIHDAAASKFGPRKILSWNCRGAGDPKVIRAVRKLCETYKPSIVLLLETRICGDDDVKNVRKKLGFSSSYCVDSVGFIGGVWILWHKDEVVIDIIPNDTRSSPNLIFAAAKFIPQDHESSMEADDWVLT